MKKIVQLILSGIVFLLPACSETEREMLEQAFSANELQVNFTIPGIEVQTYGVTALPAENNVEELYTLFFYPASHDNAANQYVDYTRSTVTTSGAGKGTVRIEMPNEEDVEEEWQIIFITNLDRYANLDGSASVHAWLGKILKPNQVTGLTISQARPLLTAFTSSEGISVSLPMSAEITKSAGVSEVDITLSRRVARVDVANTASDFELVNAYIGNTRKYAYLINDGSIITSEDPVQFTSCQDQVMKASVTPDGQEIAGGLYVFPNIVSTPAQQESSTTSLIVGGRYNGNSSISYYRIPVCPDGASQYLKGNGVYTVDIQAVSAAGSATPETAVTGSVTYTVNKWEEGYHTDYVFDKEGNGLAVSQRIVTFSENGNQTIEIEVFRIARTLDPENWNVSTVSGTDAGFFSALKKPGDTENCRVELSALFDNETETDRQAQVNITWGNLSIAVSLNQLSPTSRMDGIQASPNYIWLKPEGDTKELNLRIMGDLTGITATSITHTILYEEGETGWITQVNYDASASDPATGYYTYQVTTSAMNLVARQASIKFVVTHGERVSTASVIIRQSRVDTGVDARQLIVYVMEKTDTDTYTNRGVLTDWHGNRVRGLPAEYQARNHLVFPAIEHEQVIYRFTLVSAQDWKVVMPRQTAQRMSVGLTEAVGDPFTLHTFEVKAIADVENTPWHGQFYIEFTDGTRFEYVVHQSGVMKTLGPIVAVESTTNSLDPKMYYYDFIWVNNELWLDRHLGAWVGYDPDDPSIGYYNYFNGAYQDPGGRGVRIAGVDKNSACPAGFRVPTKAECQWLLTTGLFYSGDNWCLVVSNTPSHVHYWSLPLGSSSFHGYESYYYTLTGLNQYTETDYSLNNGFIRCVRDN